ncbi:MAG: S-layer homology domain-containing protein, partial [Clostridiales bacterium]|nr:S-layer homology domain-containing protein [Clostridiales bacterium]
ADDAPSAWAVSEVERALDYGLIPNGMYHSFLANMTRAEFCRLAMALYAKVTGESGQRAAVPAVSASSPVSLASPAPPVFTDTDDAAILKAYSLGIVKGTGGGLFSPDLPVTRQEIAVMLFNTIGAIDKAAERNILKASASPMGFSDYAAIADWALPAVSGLKSNDIMLGDDENRFNPENNTTKEMAFILVKRIYLIYAGVDASKAFPVGYSGEILMRVKGTIPNGAADTLLIGDVHEAYPDVTGTALRLYLEGGPFLGDDGASYFLDMAESLSESVSAAGYSGGAAGSVGYYPVYVLIRDGDPRSRLYLVLDDDGKYRCFRDAARKELLTTITFSDVTFPIPDATEVLLDGAEEASGALTFAELQSVAPELLDQVLWRVRLINGGVTHLVAQV